MTPYQAYVLYLALKRHFTTDKYDFIQYNGKLKVSKESFETRNDKYSFSKLANKKDPKGFLIANFIRDTETWIGNLVDEDSYNKIYLEWYGRKNALAYNFRNELDNIEYDLDTCIKVKGGYPKLLDLYMCNIVSAETIVILDSILDFFPYWDNNIKDTIVYPEYARKIKKYKPFVRFDKDVMRNIMKEKWVYDI